MIQAPLPKPVETPKPLKAADASNTKSKASGEAEVSIGDNEFASELEASLSTGAEVKPVQITSEQILEMPSHLVQPGTVETTSPKVFDPALTKGVEKLIQPKTTEAEVQPLTDAQVIELAKGVPQEAMPAAALLAGLQVAENGEAAVVPKNGEVAVTEVAKNINGEVKVPVEGSAEVKAEVTAEIKTDAKAEALQAMLKTPQVKSGRAPAIDFAKAEIDPQLLTNEDFVAQKNLVTKKPVAGAYGMKTAPVQQQKIALESGLKTSQVIKEAPAAAESSTMNSQQFILGLQMEQKPAQMNDAAPVKTFDMSNIKTANTNEIITQITDYVIQAKTAKEPTVNMRVNHEDLGIIDITVSKSGPSHESVAINIGTHSADGKTFFQQNSKDLFSHLTTAGLNISDLKVETPTQTAKNDFDFGSQSGKGGQQGSEKHFGSEQNQRRHEQERRQDLWKLLNKEAA